MGVSKIVKNTVSIKFIDLSAPPFLKCVFQKKKKIKITDFTKIPYTEWFINHQFPLKHLDSQKSKKCHYCDPEPEQWGMTQRPGSAPRAPLLYYSQNVNILQFAFYVGTLNVRV